MPKEIKKEQLEKLPGPVQYVLNKWLKELEKRKLDAAQR